MMSMYLTLCRYLRHELLRKGALKDMPPWATAWCDSTNQNYIFTNHQKKTYSYAHLEENCWYLECPKNFCSPEEEATKLRLNGGVPMAADSNEPVAQTPAKELSREEKEKAVKEKKALAAKLRREKKKQEATQTTVTSTPSAPLAAAPSDAPAASEPPVRVMQRQDDPDIEDITGERERGRPMLSTQMSAQPSQSVFSTHPSLSYPIRAPSAPMSQTKLRQRRRCRQLVLNKELHVNMFDEISEFSAEINRGKRCTVLGKDAAKSTYVDLVIADVPDNLPVPGVSHPEDNVPEWNTRPCDYFKNLFQFADEYLHDDGAVFFIYSDDNDQTRKEIESYFPAFGFKVFKDWTGVNRMCLKSARIRGSTTSMFKVALLVRTACTHPRADKTPRHSKFDFRASQELQSLSIDLCKQDAIVNFTVAETLTVNADGPWRGPKEKDPTFFSSLILSATDEENIVVDIAAATGEFNRYQR